MDEIEWQARAVSDGHDVSGFVKSKEDGERLLELVHEVLGKKNTDSWLDYRVYEPNWIQFKFRATEFDPYRVKALAESNDNKINKEILLACKLIGRIESRSCEYAKQFHPFNRRSKQKSYKVGSYEQLDYDIRIAIDVHCKICKEKRGCTMHEDVCDEVAEIKKAFLAERE